MEQFTTLNNIYQGLHKEKQEIIELIELHEYSYTTGYFPFHAFKKNNEFMLEQYPIPVITVNNRFDIGVDLYQIFIEFKLPMSVAMSFDFHLLDMYQFEVYGIDDYYDDYYFEDIDQIHQNLASSDEEEIGISILINKEDIKESVLNVFHLLDSLV